MICYLFADHSFRRFVSATTDRLQGQVGSSMKSKLTFRRRENVTRSHVIVGLTRMKMMDRSRLRLNRPRSIKELSVSHSTLDDTYFFFFLHNRVSPSVVNYLNGRSPLSAFCIRLLYYFILFYLLLYALILHSQV